MVLRLNLYAVVFIMLAVLSNVVLLCVFDQGVLAILQLSSSCSLLHFARSVGLKNEDS